jgi:hypothetical protein
MLQRGGGVAEWFKAAVLKAVTRHSPTNRVYVRKFFNAFRTFGFGGVFIWSAEAARGQEGKLKRSQLGHRN